MNRKEVKALFEKLSNTFNVPVPNYDFIQRKRFTWLSKRDPSIEYSNLDTTSFCFTHKSKKSRSFIILSETSRGIVKAAVVHEFFHYLDRMNDKETNEKSVRSRTRKWMRENKN